MEKSADTLTQRKPFTELTDTEKIERMATVIQSMSNQAAYQQTRINNLNNEVYSLSRHQHGGAGEVLVLPGNQNLSSGSGVAVQAGRSISHSVLD